MRHLLRIGDLTPPEINHLVQLSGEVKGDPKRFRGSLEGKSIGLFFMKQSVRTWVSTEVAAIELGLHPVVIRNEQIGLGVRETPEDVGRVLERYLDLIGMRVFDHKDLDRVASAVQVPVVNLLSDVEHPCQALADLQTIAERRALPGTVVAYVGDGNNTAASLAGAVVRSGGVMRVASPEDYQLPAALIDDCANYGEIVITHDPTEAVTGADVVYTDVWTSMGQELEAAERRRAFDPYRVDGDLMALAAPGAVFMHCLPAHRGEEVTDEVIESSASVVFDQAENRLHSFKAILLASLS